MVKMAVPKQKKLRRKARRQAIGSRALSRIPLLFPTSSDGLGEVLEALGCALSATKNRWSDCLVGGECAGYHRRAAGEIGPFRFSRAPYLEEPQRAIVDPDCPEVVLNWASQCGKSELWLIMHCLSLVGPQCCTCASCGSDRTGRASRVPPRIGSGP